MKWTAKYRPETLDEMYGNSDARNKLQSWAADWDNNTQPAILYGPPGLGKTTAAHAISNEHDWENIEMNASEQRTKDIVEKVAGGATSMGTLTKGASGKRLVILDEADSLHGNADRGGSSAMTSVVKNSKQPTILIVNDFYEMSTSIRNNCVDIEFEPSSPRSIVKLLEDICEEENVSYTTDALRKIANNANGDIRGAVSDLQAVTAHGTRDINEINVDIGTRDQKENMFSYLDFALKNGSSQEVHEHIRDVDETPDDIFQWVEDNITKEYSPDELLQAYQALSRADKWLGRVYSSDYNYKYWKYATDELSAGVAAARIQSHSGWTRWGPPSYWRKLGSTSSKRSTRDDIATSMGEQLTVSTSTIRTEIFPYIRHLIHHCKPRDVTVELTAALQLDASDISYVTGSGESTNKVQSIVEDAENLREEEAFNNTFAGNTLTSSTDIDSTVSETTSNTDTDVQSETLNSIASSNTDNQSSNNTDEEDETNSSTTTPDTDSSQTTLF